MKYYYFDEKGKKKKYVGNVIDNQDGTYSGVLTKTNVYTQNVELKYNEEYKQIIDTDVKYTYVDKEGNEVEFTDFKKLKQSESGSYYFEVRDVKTIDLKWNDYVPESTYLTYNGKLFTGKVIFDEKTNTYFGEI